MEKLSKLLQNFDARFLKMTIGHPRRLNRYSFANVWSTIINLVSLEILDSAVVENIII